MAEAQGAGGAAGRLVIRNIGLMLSGDLDRPILDGDTIIAENGRITAIGRARNLDTGGASISIAAPPVSRFLALPMAVILPFSAMIVSPSRIGRSRSPDSISPIFRITNRPAAPPAPCASAMIAIPLISLKEA